MMHHYVYKLLNPFTGEFYFGVRTSKLNPVIDSYMGSAKRWKPNKNQLIKSVIKTFDTRNDASLYEIEIIKLYIDNTLNRNYFIPTIGFCVFGTKPTEEHLKKMSISAKKWAKEHPEIIAKRVISKETRAKMALGNTGKKHTEEAKLKMSKSHKEWLEKNPNPFLGRHHTEETKSKLREKNSNWVPSEENRSKMREARNKWLLENECYWVGKKHSDEAKAKMSKARKGVKISEERRLKMVGRKHTDESKLIMSMKAKERWSLKKQNNSEI